MTEAEWLACEDPGRMLTYLTTLASVGGPSDRKLRLFACACRRQMPGYDWNGWDGLNGSGWVYMEEHPEEEVIANGDPAQGTIPAIEHARLFLSDNFPHRPTQDVATSLLRDIVGNPLRPFVVLPRDIVQVLERGPKNYRRRDVILASCLTPAVLSLARAAYENRLGRGCRCTEGKVWDGRGGDGWFNCPNCHGTGRIEDGTLDPDRLAILADALEEAGCLADEETDCPKCKGDGLVVVPASARVGKKCRKCKGGKTVHVPSPLLTHLRFSGPHVRGCWALDLVLGNN